MKYVTYVLARTKSSEFVTASDDFGALKQSVKLLGGYKGQLRKNGEVIATIHKSRITLGAQK